jgi:F0F1-type ATP synthase membrane subunit b/b'
MEDKLLALANKLVEEGVQEAQRQAHEILSKAHAEAEGIKQNALLQRDQILEEGNRQLQLMRLETKRELTQLVRYTLDQIEKELKQLLTAEALRKPLETSLDQNLAAIIKLVIAQLYTDHKGRIYIELPENARDEVRKLLLQNLKQYLATEPEITTSNTLWSGFRIGREGDHYRLSFSADDFEATLSEFMKESIRQLMPGRNG